jgi:hypothetical protein
MTKMLFKVLSSLAYDKDGWKYWSYFASSSTIKFVLRQRGFGQSKDIFAKELALSTFVGRSCFSPGD